MKNKVELKRHLLCAGVIMSVLLVLFALLQYREYQQYTQTYNQKMDAVAKLLKETYPSVTDQELMELLNAEEGEEGVSIFERYGIDIERDSVFVENQRDFSRYLVENLLLFIVALGIFAGIFLTYNSKKDKELKEITKYIEEINQKNYQLDLDTISEDELSILKSEIYKTTVMLKEIAENSQKDKENLKQSLSDISHQLKTPITSILVILDNLMDDPEMEADVRLDFLRDVKREIANINFLVQALLKMSKLDSDTVVFFRDEIRVSALIDQVVQNTGVLCDLKNITIERDGEESSQIKCDFRWQVEALTNILKNCVEYSPENESVQIETKTNEVYTMISIRDFGKGIDEEDQKHIFERFYKGKNATPESVGIGLALAKSIIKSDNGAVSVESANPGTRFIIKYYK